ncbi:MAG: hypothetical protein RR651_11780 [Lysinibacillus sp.]
MANTIVISILLLLLILQSIVHSRERKDLYNRLMSRDIYEYQRINDSRTGDTTQKPRESSNLMHQRIKKSYRLLRGSEEE